MKKQLTQLCFVLGLMTASIQTMALTDTYYATGEDLDFIIESDNTDALRELEYELRKFVLFRKIEDYIFNLGDEFLENNE